MFRQKKAKNEDCQSNVKHIKEVLSEIWHWVYGAVILASLPLILTVVYEVICGTNMELLGHKFFSDCLLATFALAACIYSVSTGGKTKDLCRDVSQLSMIFCCAVYLAYYELETLFQWIPAERVSNDLQDSIQLLTQLCQDHLENLFIICVVLYAVNAIFGIWITAQVKIDALPSSLKPGPFATKSTDGGTADGGN